jgi:hypothetical protein
VHSVAINQHVDELSLVNSCLDQTAFRHVLGELMRVWLIESLQCMLRALTQTVVLDNLTHKHSHSSPLRG